MDILQNTPKRAHYRQRCFHTRWDARCERVIVSQCAANGGVDVMFALRSSIRGQLELETPFYSISNRALG